MSLRAGAQCMQCYLERTMDQARKLGDEQQATVFFKKLLQVFLDAPEGVCAPWFAPQAARLLQEVYGQDFDRYQAEKAESNAFVLERLDQIRVSVEGAEDPLLAGLQHAILGNYLDFSGLRGQVSYDQLQTMLRSAAEIHLDEQNYAAFRADLAQARRLLYITDNAGEIGFDRILAEKIAELYPQLEITFLVRGGPANNDATADDAAAVGIPFPVIGNGNLIPGTVIELLGPQAKEALEAADVILSKGQGNVETLYGCGYNVYYAFLIKCPRFIELFGQPKLTPLLLREQK